LLILKMENLMQTQSQDIHRLISLLKNTTNTKKHSAYQVLPEIIKNLIGKTDIKFYPKYEKERLNYITKKVNIKDKTILDIGCNTGYFVFEFLEQEAKKITCYEGGKHHSQFVELATQLIKQEKTIKVISEYYDFNSTTERCDIVLLLNVLHHLGDDYGEKNQTRAEAKDNMLNQLNSMSRNTNLLIFQMGFNWKGDINQCLFEQGTKSEMIHFIKNGTKGYWDIMDIGVAVGSKQNAEYIDLNDENIERKDSLGEFLNRPLFIMKSLLKD